MQALEVLARKDSGHQIADPYLFFGFFLSAALRISSSDLERRHSFDISSKTIYLSKLEFYCLN